MVNEYSEATIRIYLFKGVHHFIKCLDNDKVEFSDLETEDEEYLSLLCFNGYESITVEDDEC